MIDFESYDIKLQNLYETYAKFDDDIKFDDAVFDTHKAQYTKDSKVSSEQELQEIETIIQCPIPPSIRKFFSHYSRRIWFSATLPEAMVLPDSLRQIFSARFLICTEGLVLAEESRKNWIEDCFSDPNDDYDKVWHNKLGFMNVPNGDVIAFDLGDPKDDKRVVYLSHDDGEGHGYLLGESFSDYFSKLLLIGACGNEDWQLLPFTIDNISGINPNCDNAKIYREAIGLSW